ncbi:MAG TPA: chorismate-binding protein, partial [Flavipsychrobacter sp.]|nr:chorismate-binding protein [Flavipsychrobacter sp.]
MSFEFKTRIKKRLADTETPVSIYLKIRGHFSESILFECCEHKSKGYSYICFQPISSIVVTQHTVKIKYPNESSRIYTLDDNTDIIEEITGFAKQFSVNTDNNKTINGIWGHINFDAVQYFENIKLDSNASSEKQIPDIRFSLYRFMIIFDHHNNELQLVELYTDENEENSLQKIEALINRKSLPVFPFKIVSAEYSDSTDNDFLKIISKGKAHCKRGDVFQIVLSREFSIDFHGDDFNVYRSLRSINSSPYMFYFDYGDYRLFGTSPETQLKITNRKASIHPIAGTYRRTGDTQTDISLADQLKDDKKENAEHTMLVDLARNDLSKHYKNVDVTIYKEIQSFSHVIHIV